MSLANAGTAAVNATTATMLVRSLIPFSSSALWRGCAGADEVSLTIRLIHRRGFERSIDACEERCLKEIRRSLKALGARET
jgi:hypothetical protein